MRIAILGFLAGIFWLQQQASLPSLWWWTLPFMLFALVWLLRQDRSSGVRVLRHLFILFAAVALGIAWAAWRAELRLAYELPRDWEGRDVEVIGAIASLPREVERGSRFEFNIERVLTPDAVIPQRVSLSWYAETHRKTGEVKPPPGAEG